MFQHPGLSQDGLMLAVPDHVAVRLVRKDHEVGSAHDVRDLSQVLPCCHTARRIVR